MGDLTRAQLMSQAGLAAGNDQCQQFIRVWLNAWLKRTAKGWAYPFLKVRIENVPLNASAASVEVGLGATTPLYLHRIFNPLFIYTFDKKTRGRMYIRDLIEGDPDKDQSATNVADRLGMPTTCRIYTSGSDVYQGKFTVFPDPAPDKQYYLAFDAHVIPAGIPTVAASDTTVPWYPEDKTLLQACKCAIIEYDDGGEGNPKFDVEMQKLAAMVIDDRDFNGEGPGDNQLMALDKGVFR